MSSSRSPFEKFWSYHLNTRVRAASESDLERVREYKRELRRELGKSPSGFVSADAPLGTKTLFKQAQDINRLAALASAEGSAIQSGSWPELVSPKASFEANRDTLFDEGAKVPEDEREDRDYRRAQQMRDAAEKQATDTLREIGQEVYENGGDGSNALLMATTTNDVNAVDEPIDQTAFQTIRDIAEAYNDPDGDEQRYGDLLVRDIAEELRLEYEGEPEGAPTATDEQGRPIRDADTVAEELAAGFNSGVIDVLDNVTNVELRYLLEALQNGGLDEQIITELNEGLLTIPEEYDDVMGTLAARNPYISQLYTELGLDAPTPVSPDLIPEPPFTPEELTIAEARELTEQAQQAGEAPPIEFPDDADGGEIDAETADNIVDAALDPTAGQRSRDYWQSAVDTLDTERPQGTFGSAIARSDINAQDVIDALPPSLLRYYRSVAENQLEGVIAAELEPGPPDFPNMDAVVRRGPGRSVHHYWEPLKEQLQSGDPDWDGKDILRREEVPDEEIDLLMRADEVRQHYIEQVQQNIDAIVDERDDGRAPPGAGRRGAEVEDIDDLQDVDRTPAEGSGARRPEFRGLTEFQRLFIELARDVGWCDKLPCRNPQQYFNMSEARQQRNYDMTPVAYLHYWVSSGDVTREELRNRGFPLDVIPDE